MKNVWRCLGGIVLVVRVLTKWYSTFTGYPHVFSDWTMVNSDDVKTVFLLINVFIEWSMFMMIRVKQMLEREKRSK